MAAAAAAAAAAALAARMGQIETMLLPLPLCLLRDEWVGWEGGGGTNWQQRKRQLLADKEEEVT